MQVRARASYDGLRGFSEGLAVIAYGERVVDTNVFYSNPGFAKAMRVSRFISLPPPDENMLKHADTITRVRDLMVHKTWTAKKADVAVAPREEITALAEAYAACRKAGSAPAESGMGAVAGVFALHNPLEFESETASGAATGGGAAAGPPLTGKPLPPIPPSAQTAPPSPAQQQAPAQPPQQQAPAAPPPAEAAPAPAEANANPMAFFGAKKPEAAAAPEASLPAQAAPAPQEAPASKGINWQDLISQAASEEAKQEAPPAAAAAPQSAADRLDPETARILREAGQAARAALTGEAADAAE
jgi:intracellular multiplication protein IcmO